MIVAYLCVCKSKKHYNLGYMQQQQVLIYTLLLFFEKGFN